MSLQPLAAPRFVRRTSLGPNEYRKNFRQIDRGVIEAVTSPEADRVTPLMSKIYLRLANAPEEYWEREGVLRFEADPAGEGRRATAWARLCEVAGVASATAAKALRWMHEQGIIGYYAGKNGVGIRVFLNRASSSIGVRTARAGEKILPFACASSRRPSASAGEAAFSDSYAVSEVLETDLNPRAPKSGAGQTEVVKNCPDSLHDPTQPVRHSLTAAGNPVQHTLQRLEVPVGEIVSRLRAELEPALQSAAMQAAAREHDRTREWFESRGLPKAARVAQREAYDVLRRQGLIGAAVSRPGLAAATGCSADTALPRTLSSSEVRELAETCVAMLEVHGLPIDVTLAGLVTEAGGSLLREDVPKVRTLAEEMASGGRKGG